MFKKALFLTLLLLLPFGASANCDLSVKNVQTISKTYLDAIRVKSQKNIGKPKLVVSKKKVKGYYAEELNGVITIYPKKFKDYYCDQYIDTLSPFVAQVISHEYTHFLDEKIHLSKKIGEKEMSEKTATIGEEVFGKITQPNKSPEKKLTEENQKKYDKFLRAISRLLK